MPERTGLERDTRQRLEDALRFRRCAEQAALWCEIAAQTALGVGTLTAVASGFYGLPTLVFITAALNTVSAAFGRATVSNRRRATTLAHRAEKLAAAIANASTANALVRELTPLSVIIESPTTSCSSEPNEAA